MCGGHCQSGENKVFNTPSYVKPYPPPLTQLAVKDSYSPMTDTLAQVDKVTKDDVVRVSPPPSSAYMY